MVYTSKRRKFKDFVRTNNWRYYIIFLLIFATLVTSVVIITSKKQNEKNNPTNNTLDIQSNTTTPITNDNNTNVRGRYKIDINTAINQISIYEWDNNNESYKTEVYKYMPVAPDKSIEVGEYSFTSDDITKETWYTTPEGKHYRYTTNFSDAISFHSAEFSAYNDKNSLVLDSYNCIGKSDSTDGFLLLCSDAKWIYENCSYASEVTIYNDDSESVSTQVTKVIELAPGLSWDPTDNSSSSPYCPTAIKEFKCIYDNITVNPGTDIANLFKYVKAIDSDDKNINSYIYTNTSGKLDEIKSYSITFYIADIFGNVFSDELIVEVVEPEPPTEDVSEGENESESTDDTELPSEDDDENVTDPTEESNEGTEDNSVENDTQDQIEPNTEDET